MLYLNLIKSGIELPIRLNLTLTSVVFEYQGLLGKSFTKSYLTLTSVVFE